MEFRERIHEVPMLRLDTVSTRPCCVWQGFRAVFKLWDLAEAGTIESGVFTRVMLVSGTRR